MRSMKSAAVIAVLCSGFVFAQKGQEPSGSQDAFRTEVLRLRDRVWRAWFVDDEATLRQLVSGDAVVISAGEKDWKNRDDVLREAREFRHAGGSLLKLSFPRTAVQCSRDSAFVYSDYVLEISTHGTRTVTRGRATEVFVLRRGKWVNTGWHTDQQ